MKCEEIPERPDLIKNSYVDGIDLAVKSLHCKNFVGNYPGSGWSVYGTKYEEN
jgi:hypothetical protein